MNNPESSPVKFAPPNQWHYKCTCGAEMYYESETKPKKLIKCFRCQKPLPEEFKK